MPAMKFRRSTAAVITALAVIAGIVSSGTASADDNAGCTPNTKSAMTPLGTISQVRLWSYGDYPVFLHILPVAYSTGPKIEVESSKLPNGFMWNGYTTTLRQWAQIDVVAAPVGQPERHLKAIYWNSEDGDINIMARGSLAQNATTVDWCMGWR